MKQTGLFQDLNALEELQGFRSQSFGVMLDLLEKIEDSFFGFVNEKYLPF